jgi:hypothetical protein
MFQKKKKAKDFDFNLILIEKIESVELQNKYLFEKIQKLEQRIERLEPKEVQKRSSNRGDI